MARMLGMGGVISEACSTTEHYELVTRLEKLILANQSNIGSTLPVDSDFSDLAAAFRNRDEKQESTPLQHDDDDDDNDDAGGGGDDGGCSDVVDVPNSSRSIEGHPTRFRSRSLSPVRNRDPNVY